MPFNTVHYSLGMCKHVMQDFSEAQVQFWLDVIPGATNDSCGWHRELNRSPPVESLTTVPWRPVKC